MSCTFPGIQDLLDKTLADLEVWSRRFDKRPPEAPCNQHFPDSELQSRTKTQNIFSFHYSVFSFYFSIMVLKTNKQERKKKVYIFQEGIFVTAIN